MAKKENGYPHLHFVTVDVEIPQAEHEILMQTAEKLGLDVKTLIQQEVDASLIGISIWAQRLA